MTVIAIPAKDIPTNTSVSTATILIAQHYLLIYYCKLPERNCLYDNYLLSYLFAVNNLLTDKVVLN